MKIAPILFSTPMVKSILNGSKTQTRRIIKPQPEPNWIENTKKFALPDGSMFDRNGQQLFWIENPENNKEILPKANKGDIFWVRETFVKINIDDEFKGSKTEFAYKASFEDAKKKYGEITNHLGKRFIDSWKWKPSIFMPKDACRIFLKVKNVRVERLHDISDDDAKNEGIYITDDYWGEKAPLNYMYGTENGFKHEYFFSDNPYGMENVPSHSGWKASFYSLWWSINGRKSLQSNPFLWVYDLERIEKPLEFIAGVGKVETDKK